ncbi:MAG: transporter substrate-binding domain-containing protein [Collinsella sp.]
MASPVPSELLGSYRFAQQRPDRPHHRRHERHARARGVRRLSDPYFIGYFGLFVKEGSPYQNATKLSDFSGATVLGQKDTMLDTVIDEIPGVVHKNPVDSVPTVFSNLLQGTCDAVTYNTENEKGYMAQNPGIVPIRFAEGEGFKQEVTANVGCRKGSDKLLKLIDKTLKGISQEERDQMWDAPSRLPPSAPSSHSSWRCSSCSYAFRRSTAWTTTWCASLRVSAAALRPSIPPSCAVRP